MRGICNAIGNTLQNKFEWFSYLHRFCVLLFFFICGMRAIFRNYVTLNTPARVLEISVCILYIYTYMVLYIVYHIYQQLYRVSFVQRLGKTLVYLACLTIAKWIRRSGNRRSKNRNRRTGSRRNSRNSRSSLTTLSKFWNFNRVFVFYDIKATNSQKEIKTEKTDKVYFVYTMQRVYSLWPWACNALKETPPTL